MKGLRRQTKVFKCELETLFSGIATPTDCRVSVIVQPRGKILDEDGTELTEEILDLVVKRVFILELKAVRQPNVTLSRS